MFCVCNSSINKLNNELLEHDTSLVTTLHPLDRKYSLNDSSLSDVANVDSGSEARNYLCRME